MAVDPELVAILSALALAAAAGLPGLQRRLIRRRRALRRCLVCARTVVLGERTCDCTDEPA